MDAAAAVEGWLFRSAGGRLIGFVKGCMHPLPELFAVPRLIEGRKTWRLEEALRMAARLGAGFRVAPSPCLGGRVAGLVDPARAELVAPWEAARRLRSCSTGLCRAALELLESLASATRRGLVGVSGGLAYGAPAAGDIDLVVYGSGDVERVYRLLGELRGEGVTSPAPPRGHGWSRSDERLARSVQGARLLVGVYRGYEYNVRLVHCTRPSRCAPTRLLGAVELEGQICGGTGFTLPVFYTLCLRGGGVALVASWRLRYTELPPGMSVRVAGEVEEWCGGLRVVVPDHGGYIVPAEGPG